MYAIKLKSEDKFINVLNGDYIISTVPLLFKSETPIYTLNGLPVDISLLETVKVHVYVEKAQASWSQTKTGAIVGAIVGMFGGPLTALLGIFIGAVVGNTQDVKENKYEL